MRYHDDLARVELSQESLATWMQPSQFDTLRAAVLDAGFERVAIDVRGFRSGSLNVLHGVGST